MVILSNASQTACSKMCVTNCYQSNKPPSTSVWLFPVSRWQSISQHHVAQTKEDGEMRPLEVFERPHCACCGQLVTWRTVNEEIEGKKLNFCGDQCVQV